MFEVGVNCSNDMTWILYGVHVYEFRESYFDIIRLEISIRFSGNGKSDISVAAVNFV